MLQFDGSSYKEKSILVPKIPKITVRWRLYSLKIAKIAKIGIRSFEIVHEKNLVKMKGVLYYVS